MFNVLQFHRAFAREKSKSTGRQLVQIVRRLLPNFKMTKYAEVDHVIFDLDGLLLDSECFYFQTATELCQSFGKTFTSELREKVMGVTGPENARIIVEALNLPVSPEEYYELSRQKIKKLFPSAKLQTGTEEIYVEIFSTICAKYGKIYSHEVREKIMGTMERDSCAILARELDLPVPPQEILEQQSILQKEVLPKTKLMPGAEQLIRHFHKHNIPIAVATSSSEESVKLKLTNHKELFTLFHHIVMASSDPDVQKGKPNPDIFIVCASRFPDKPKPEKCLVFEDAPNGVKAARAAGMQVVMVPDQHISEENKGLATLILSSLEEFKPELFGLPPF